MEFCIKIVFPNISGQPIERIEQFIDTSNTDILDYLKTKNMKFQIIGENTIEIIENNKQICKLAKTELTTLVFKNWKEASKKDAKIIIPKIKITTVYERQKEEQQKLPIKEIKIDSQHPVVSKKSKVQQPTDTNSMSKSEIPLLTSEKQIDENKKKCTKQQTSDVSEGLIPEPKENALMNSNSLPLEPKELSQQEKSKAQKRTSAKQLDKKSSKIQKTEKPAVIYISHKTNPEITFFLHSVTRMDHGVIEFTINKTVDNKSLNSIKFYNKEAASDFRDRLEHIDLLAFAGFNLTDLTITNRAQKKLQDLWDIKNKK